MREIKYYLLSGLLKKKYIIVDMLLILQTYFTEVYGWFNSIFRL